LTVVLDVETAQFSIHVVGLIVDFEKEYVLVVDPNSGLVPGGT